MTSMPLEPGSDPAATDVPAGDLGVGGPAERPAEDQERAQTPPGYPEEVDPAEGPVTGRGAGTGDLQEPGADRPH